MFFWGWGSHREGTKFGEQRPESGGGILGEGTASPSPPGTIGGLGSAVSGMGNVSGNGGPEAGKN